MRWRDSGEIITADPTVVMESRRVSSMRICRFADVLLAALAAVAGFDGFSTVEGSAAFFAGLIFVIAMVLVPPRLDCDEQEVKDQEKHDNLILRCRIFHNPWSNIHHPDE
jgi:uncharacterized membrane protein YtjA (UPF0391 family)